MKRSAVPRSSDLVLIPRFKKSRPRPAIPLEKFSYPFPRCDGFLTRRSILRESSECPCPLGEADPSLAS